MDFSFGSNRRNSTAERLKPAVNYKKPVTFHYEIQNHTTRMQKLTKAFKVYRLTVLTLICVIAGIAIGLFCRSFSGKWTERQFMYIEIPGELYLRLLKLIIIPLLVSNVILSFGTIQGKLSSYLAKVACFLYLGSNVMALTVAIVLALIICPGKMKTLTREQAILQNIHSHTNHHLFYNNHNSLYRYHPMFYNNAEAQQEREKVVRSIQDLTTKANIDYVEDRLKVKNQPNANNNSNTNSHNHTRFDDNYFQRMALNTKLPIDVVLDILRNLIPDSLIGATMQQTRTKLIAPRELIINKDGTTSPSPSLWPVSHEMIAQSNIVGLLAISVFVGVVLSYMDESSKPLLEFCSCISELSLRIGMMSVNLAPICIMFLLIGQIARAQDLSSMAGELCMYTITVIVALIIHGVIFLPLAYYLITKRSPIEFLLNMLEAIVAAFATSSSSATMALVLNCLTDMDINPIIVRAFGPLGSVFNMNGTAIYEAIGAIFIAQTLGLTLPLGSLLLVGLSSAVASLSTTGIPSSGIMTMVIVLNAINLPVLQLSLLYIVDFIIDRFRTVINVWSGALVCGLMNHICPEHLFEDEPEKYREMVKYNKRRSTLNAKKGINIDEAPKQIISVTITPPLESSSM